MKRSGPKPEKARLPSPAQPASATSSHGLSLAVFGAGLIALVLGGIMIVGTAAAPQSETVTTAEQISAIPPDPPGTIDGARNPELIPDAVALRMIVLAVAEPADATEAQKERARAKLRPIRLSENDATTFIELLAEFRAQADALDEQVSEIYVRAPIPHPASTDHRQLVELANKKNQLVSDTVAAIPARLSEDGLVKLGSYLPEAKKGMKMFP